MKEAVRQLAERIKQTKRMVVTEEATKTSYILPFLHIMGYDVFNPVEVVPEYTTDIGMKKNEKVDYAIVLNGQPEIIIECKKCGAELNTQNEGQLLRYFHVCKARFAILTNGLIYKFYTDLEEPNKMDSSPFLTVDVREPEKINFEELERFRKSQFNSEKIRSSADLLKYSSAIQRVIGDEFLAPSSDFAKFIMKMVEPSKNFSPAQRERLIPVIKDAIQNILKRGLTVKKESNTDLNAGIRANDDIVTTQSEIEAFAIIRAIVSERISPERIYMRDAKSYCAILFDDNNRKPICRLFFNNERQKSIVLFDKKNEERFFIERPEDVYLYRDKILATAIKYLRK